MEDKATKGRPNEYQEEYVKKVDEYLASCVDEEYDWTKTDGKLLTTFEHRVKVRLPTIEGFAIFIGVSKKSLYNWAAIHSDFLHALDKIETEQKQRLLEKGLAGEYNPTIAKLILSANHGMREKSDITTDGKSLPQPIYGGLSKEEGV